MFRPDRRESRREILRRPYRALYDDHDPLLIDWRAPVAQPFNRPTTADPSGVFRRRQSLVGEAALFASLSAVRSGRMSEMVATIQAEQDAIIRADLPGVLVVQGGPGTGKTIVALRCDARLLYTQRDQLARRGVLVVGPNTTLLRYIEQVLGDAR